MSRARFSLGNLFIGTGKSAVKTFDDERDVRLGWVHRIERVNFRLNGALPETNAFPLAGPQVACKIGMVRQRLGELIHPASGRVAVIPSFDRERNLFKCGGRFKDL